MKLRSSVFGWKSVWMDFAEERKGEFVDGQSHVTVKVRIPSKPWIFAMRMHANPLGKDEHTVIATPYVARHPFKIAIRNSNSIEEFAKVLGLQDIVIGDPDFDKQYIIQGNNELLVKDFLSDRGLRKAIQAQNAVNLRIVDSRNNHFGINPPPHVDVLTFVEKGAINSFERVSSLHDLFDGILDRMAQLEFAAHQEPEYEI
jgi:hypothetical protein